MEGSNFKPKSFWQRPEGTTGLMFMLAILAGGAFVLFKYSGALLAFLGNTLGIVVTLAVLGAIIYMALDPKMRALVGYMYKSTMRAITSVFVTIDPIGILKNYVDDLESNLKKLAKQIGSIRGQMRKLKNIVGSNNTEIKENMVIARKAKELGNQKQMLLSSRKAARLDESNKKYEALHKKLSVLHRILTKMHANSEILVEDTKDQVRVKEQERKAIRTSHSAMKSAMNIINGNSDKKVMFDQAMEVIADDVANKIGEMEQFMEMSSSFMDSVDLQNGVFEEQGMRMLEEYEKKSSILLLGGAEKLDDTLDLGELESVKRDGSGNSYEGLFD